MEPIRSWEQFPRLLQQAKTPVYPIPNGKKIYFTEMCDSVSTRQSRVSNNVNSASLMTFAVNQEIFEDEILIEIFTKTILGGYCLTTNKKETPYAHPYFTGMFAKDFVEVIPMEYVTTEDDLNYATYNFCKVTINFESLEYPVDQDYPLAGSDVYNPNFIRLVNTNSSNRISTPIGWYKFIDGAYSGYPATFGSWFVQPYTNLEMTIYHCTHDQVYGVGNTFHLIPKWNDLIGQVNLNPFGGCAAGKLLFDTAMVQPWTDYLGNKMYNVRLYFIYNNWGWNKSIDPGGNISSVAYVVGGSRPFSSFLMQSLVNSLNPL